MINLSNLDGWWQPIWSNSLLGNLVASLRRSAVVSLPKPANLLQSLSFVAVVILFGALALPNFADDKEGLALITAASAAMWMLGYLMGGKETRQSVSTDLPVWGYLAANTIAAASSHYIGESIHGLQKLAVYIIAYFVFTAIFQASIKRKYITITVLMVTAIAVCLYGFYQYKMHVAPLATWEDPSVENQGTRIFSTLKNPNLLAGYLVPLAPLAAAIGIGALYKKQLLVALAAFATTGALSAAVVLTGCRGGYIGLFLGFGVLTAMVFTTVWRDAPAKRLLIGLLCLALPVTAVLVMHFALPTFDQRVLSIFSGSEHSSNAYRFTVYTASLKMLKDNWWFGVGPGNQAFIQAYGLYMRSGFDALGTYCVPLEVIVEAGILALSSFICLILSVLLRGHICFWSEQVSQSERWLAAGSCAALMAMMTQGLTDTVFYRPQVQFLFWLLVALLVTCRQNTNQTD